MKYRLVIFDFDGTLADSFPFFISSVNTLADRYGFKKVDLEDIEAFRKMDAKRILKQLGVPLWKVPLVARYYTALMAQHAESVTVFAGIETMLRTLSERGIIVSLITSNSYENVKRVLGPETLALMEHGQYGTSLFGKASKLKKVLRRTRTAPEEAIYIGDEIRDLQAARAARIDFGAVTWGYTDMDALIRLSPECVFYRVEEIAEKLG